MPLIATVPCAPCVTDWIARVSLSASLSLVSTAKLPATSSAVAMLSLAAIGSARTVIEPLIANCEVFHTKPFASGGSWIVAKLPL